VLDLLGIKDARLIAAGLTACRWLAWLHDLGKNRNGAEIWLDGGHNEGAAHALSRQIARWKEQSALPVHLVIAYAAHRAGHAEAFLRALSDSGADRVIFPDMAAQGQTYVPARTLAQTARKAGFSNIEIAADLHAALAVAKDGRILIAGSLYLAGYVLENRLWEKA